MPRQSGTPLDGSVQQRPGQGLCAAQKTAWGETPSYGNVFHIQRQCEELANALQCLALGATLRPETLQDRIGLAGRVGTHAQAGR